MKQFLTALCLLATATLSAHQGVELGPSGGRILEFSKNETLHGEVTAKDGSFHVALLDKDMKPMTITDQSLTATKGDRKNPEKLAVEVKDNHFVLPMPKGEDYFVIFQFRPSAKGRAITARLHYDAANCSKCDQPEWLCACGAKN